MTRSLKNRIVTAFLWKKLSLTDAQALTNVSYATGGGAKHLPLWKRLDVENFLGSKFRTSGVSSRPEFAVPIEGPNGETKTISIDYDRRGVSREEWLIRRQNDEDQHPAWKPGNKLPNGLAEIPGNYLFLLRLSDGSFHARVANYPEVLSMPSSISQIVLAENQGIYLNPEQSVFLNESADTNFLEQHIVTKWSRQDIRSTIADYMVMLAYELNDQQYDKATHLNELIAKLDQKNEAAIELKHGNISAILILHGLPYIDYYKPAYSYPSLLQDAVLQYISGDYGIRKVIEKAADQIPPKTHKVRDIASILVDPPSGRSQQRRQLASTPHKSRRIVDYQSREASNRKLGRQGEIFVIEFERRRLLDLKMSKLAAQIEWISETKGDGLGYDIRSFDANGSEIFIEVKTTNMGISFPFLVSANEVMVSESLGKAYRVYRIFSFSRQPKLFILEGSISESCQIFPIVFQAKVQTD